MTGYDRLGHTVQALATLCAACLPPVGPPDRSCLRVSGTELHLDRIPGILVNAGLESVYPARLDSVVATSRALIERNRSFEPGVEPPPNPDPSLLVSGLEQWLRAGERLSRAQYSAILLVADVVLEAALMDYGLWHPDRGRTLREELASLGAGFEPTRDGKSWQYTHDLLWEACRVAPPGEGRDLASCYSWSTGSSARSTTTEARCCAVS